MSDHQHEQTGFCQACAVRTAIIRLLDQTVGEGQGSVGRFLDGVIDTAAQIAAVHVRPGHEDDERKLLQDLIATRFDHFAALSRQREADEAVKQ